MTESRPNLFSDRMARVARFALLTAIAVVVSLLLIGSQNQNRGSMNPFHMGQAQADAMSAAPGYLALTVNLGAGHFHIIDTDKKVICVYSMVGDKAHLVSARKFDSDSDILAGDIPTPKHPQGLGGGNGVSRTEAKEYADEVQKMIEAIAAKPKK